MKIIMKTIHERGLSFVKLVSAMAVVVSVVGCSSGNPYVEYADRNDIISLGDSVLDSSGEIEAKLEALAGQTFRNYSRSAAEIAGGVLAPSVVDQYNAANNTDSDIDTIIMNGGGNDILIPAKLFDPYRCRTRWYRRNISNNCKNLVHDIYVDAVNLLNTMGNDGVENILYIGYYHPKGGDANLSKAVDYGNEWLGYGCDNTTANCDLTPSVNAISESDILSDDIHPNASGSAKIANLLWPKLQPLL